MGYCKLDTKGHWAVNGAPIYVPSAEIKITHENLAGSNSGRTADGVMHIDWIRRDIRKVELKYKAMTAAEMGDLIGRMQGQEFSFTFYDRGAVQTMSAYCAKSEYTYYSEELDIYTDVSINVIEM